MKKVKLKNKVFKQTCQIECVKVVLAQKIAELREDEKLTQAEFAKRLGVSERFVSQIETAEEKSLTIETLIKIAASLGRSINISFSRFSKHQQSCLKEV
ncbi:MAG: helix-turn-helix transcriptional regulator [Candidatus Omnitrophica bacterium]|nr:helix-turn-helix transcriptional regulator [Candidatus Omnitrophota bacterium]